MAAPDQTKRKRCHYPCHHCTVTHHITPACTSTTLAPPNPHWPDQGRHLANATHDRIHASGAPKPHLPKDPSQLNLHADYAGRHRALVADTDENRCPRSSNNISTTTNLPQHTAPSRPPRVPRGAVTHQICQPEHSPATPRRDAGPTSRLALLATTKPQGCRPAMPRRTKQREHHNLELHPPTFEDWGQPPPRDGQPQ